MRYYRCKCGNQEAWGSMPPNQCDKCEECGSNLAESPNSHQEPQPHDFSSVTFVETDDGDKSIMRCRYCHKTKKQIERDGQ